MLANRGQKLTEVDEQISLSWYPNFQVDESSFCMLNTAQMKDNGAYNYVSVSTSVNYLLSSYKNDGNDSKHHNRPSLVSSLFSIFG